MTPLIKNINAVINNFFISLVFAFLAGLVLDKRISFFCFLTVLYHEKIIAQFAASIYGINLPSFFDLEAAGAVVLLVFYEIQEMRVENQEVISA